MDLTPRKNTKRRKLNNAGSCVICTENYNARRNKRVSCPYSCGLEACTVCHIKYMENAATDFHCMGCRREWDVRFMRQNFSVTDLKRLNKYYRMVLLQREEAHFPAVQLWLERQQALQSLNRRIVRLQSEVELLKVQRNAFYASESKEVKSVNVTVKCRMSGCRGYTTNGVCGLCKKRLCSKCMQELVDGHCCTAEDVANTTYLRENSKACPECGMWTSKTEGCDQMFCVNCHTAWNWVTLAKIQGVIHNPHYFEWQKRTRGSVERNPMDVLCGGLPRVFHLFSTNDILNHALRKIYEIQDLHLRYPPRPPNNRLIHARYLQNEINREQLSSLVFRRFNRFKLSEQQFYLYQMLHSAGSDILQRAKRENVEAITVELEELRWYYNQQIAELARENRQAAYFTINPYWMGVTKEVLTPKKLKQMKPQTTTDSL